MPDQRILFLLDAKNLASKEAQKLRKDLVGVSADARTAGGGIGSWTSALGGSRLAMLGVAGVVGAVVLGLKGAAEAAIAEERNIAKLDAALKANIAGWDGNRDAIEKRIEVGERLAFSDDEQRASLALLVGATKDVTKAQALQATAMDLARFKSISLEAASTALVKVEGGQFRALKALGIQLREGATGTEALAAVQKVAAGQALAYADTAGGAFESLGIVFGDIVEDVGAMLLPILKDLAVFARDTLIPAIRDIAGFVGEVAGVIGGLADVIGDFFDSVTTDYEEFLIAQGALFPKMIGELEKLPPAAGEAGEGYKRSLLGPLARAQLEASKIAKATPLAIAKSLRDGSDPVKVAAELLKDAIKNSLTPAKEIAALEGILTGSALAKALNDKRPEVVAAGQAWKSEVEARLFALRNGVPQIALATGQLYGDALQTKRDDIGRATVTALAGARTAMTAMKADAGTWGTGTGAAYSAGIAAGIKSGIYGTGGVYWSVTKIRNIMEAGSPPGPDSPLHKIDVWGRRTGQAWTEGMVGGIDAAAVRRALGAIGSEVMPGGGSAFGQTVSGIAQQGGIGGGVPVSIPIYLDGRQIAEVVDEHLYYARAAAAR